MSRRAEIAMTAAEAADLLAAARTVTCATNGRRGWPHLMPLWYVIRSQPTSPAGIRTQPTSPAGTGSDALWAWTYAKSQKVRNLERDPRCTLQVETGTEYAELRGVMLECDVVIHRDLETVAALGADIAARYGGGAVTPEAAEALRRQAAKRVGLQFIERRRASWDHRKLGGTY